ncbi:MAG: hypothetical protein HYX22_01790 [Candidatus Yanofskybacteria bacterium]|nr:hypothetical protein [Candidatus Yanofskybacteria bacterium]
MTLFYFVNLYELDKDARQKKIATFKMTEDELGRRVEIDGDHSHPVVESVKNEGIFDYKNARPGKLYPYDGMSFLENLKYYFRSGYLLATDVQRSTTPTP